MQSFLEYKQLLENLLLESKDNTAPNEDAWNTWRKLVNMSEKDIKKFYDSDEGKDAGMKKSEADKIQISNGRESARWLMKMLSNGETFKSASENWTPNMWRWCRKQISFISRMKGMRKRMIGNPFERNGEMTRWLKSMLIWGHDPRKPLRKI